MYFLMRRFSGFIALLAVPLPAVLIELVGALVFDWCGRSLAIVECLMVCVCELDIGSASERVLMDLFVEMPNVDGLLFGDNKGGLRSLSLLSISMDENEFNASSSSSLLGITWSAAAGGPRVLSAKEFSKRADKHYAVGKTKGAPAIGRRTG